ncbi:DUF417 family protein [Paraflavitalea sp. CAU 1676]|uniref:DoxX family membrane protein n=1 Tax=Paraflavitalea sp. CAU 1676 TaxID=3032598 RepID=UPI0023DB6355|nr:DUF417 family protein [Paraflavitalea sp. CAU 1676]MDF2190597.1 DUF417 family protein [Paraflavitalea sp. CAU 1676]
MRFNQVLPQAFLRLALGVGFISPSLDRLGGWGPYGTPGVAWGDWQHFSAYAHQLMYFLPDGMAEVFAILATILELLLGVLLIIGLWTKWAALSSGVLALTFAICMTLAFGIRAPLDYSVFAVSAAGFFLSTITNYPWSIDNAIAKRTRQ